MKCPHCSQEHPDDFLLCPYTGKPLKPQTKVCENPDCQYPNVPIEAKFCPRCGFKLFIEENGEEICESFQNNESILFITYQDIDDEEDEEDSETFKYVQIFNETQKTPIFRKVLKVWDYYCGYPLIYQIDGHDYLFINSIFNDAKYEISILGINNHFTEKYNLCFKESKCDFLLKKSKGDKFGRYHDVINRHTKKTICSGVLSEGNDIEKLRDGWHQIVNYPNEDCTNLRYILFNDEKVIQLDTDEFVLSDSWFTDNGFLEDYYINENRIITGVLREDEDASYTMWHKNLTLIRIRDYNGCVIKELSPECIVKSPFRHGKAAFLLSNGNVGFIKLTGEFEMIPNTTLLCEDVYDNAVSLFFISNENLAINNIDESEKYAVIVNVKGEVIFDNVYRLEFLTEKYVKYTDRTHFMDGVIDNNGNVILRALYKHIQVLQ
ncbi:zinc ribbon domain-containing protein, partial [Phocaeicola vulgatus]|uniref:zinc ribbon domain-containing protein n=1 Tax=Phocaeicola vulgatus TaxID=821 RepID=UPI0035660DE7